MIRLWTSMDNVVPETIARWAVIRTKAKHSRKFLKIQVCVTVRDDTENKKHFKYLETLSLRFSWTMCTLRMAYNVTLKSRCRFREYCAILVTESLTCQLAATAGMVNVDETCRQFRATGSVTNWWSSASRVVLASGQNRTSFLREWPPVDLYL